MVQYDGNVDFYIGVFGKIVGSRTAFEYEWKGDLDGEGSGTLHEGDLGFFVIGYGWYWRKSCSDWGIPNVTQKIFWRITATDPTGDIPPFSGNGEEQITNNPELPYKPPPKPPPPTCPEGEEWDATLGKCVPTVTPPTPPKPKPPTPSPPTQPTNPLDLAGWVSYAAQLIAYSIDGLISQISDLMEWVIATFWKALPESLRNILGALERILRAMIRYALDPVAFLNWVLHAWWTDEPSSPQENLTRNLSRVIKNAQTLATQPEQLLAGILQPLIDYSSIVTNEINEVLDSPTEQAAMPQRAAFLYKKISEILAQFNTFAASAEVASLGQIEAVSTAADRILTQTGWRDISLDLRVQLYNANIGRHWQRFLNRLYLAGLPAGQEIIRARRLELIEQKDFETAIAESDGINPKWSQILYDSSLDPPGLDDFITFNIRHPEAAWSWEKFSAVANIDVKRYLDIFKERQFRDPSITEARFMYETGSIDEAFVLDIVRRNRFRTEALPGQSKSDAQAVTDFLTSFQTRIWYRQELLALRASYMKGLSTEDVLRTSAGKLLTNPKAVEAYITAAKERKKVQDETFDLIPLATLLDIVKTGTRDLAWMDTQIERFDYSPEDIQTLKDYMHKKYDDWLAKQAEAEAPTA